MIETGKYQIMQISHQVDFGLYLKQKNSEDETTILLPKKEIPENFELDDDIEVYIYRDSEDRQIATTKKGIPEIGEIGVYNVLEVTKIGAFMDWGLSKDLFLPYSQQRVKVKTGRKYLASVYVDKSDRICATTYVGKFLRTDHNYQQGDEISGTIFRIRDDFGAIVAVDNLYLALIPINQVDNQLKAGDSISGYIARVLEDGKIDMSLVKAAYLQQKDDADAILDAIIKNEGFLDMDDKSSPDMIKRKFDLSKKAFKRALGKLLKQNKIIFKDGGIYLK